MRRSGACCNLPYPGASLQAPPGECMHCPSTRRCCFAVDRNPAVQSPRAGRRAYVHAFRSGRLYFELLVQGPSQAVQSAPGWKQMCSFDCRLRPVV